MRLHECVNGCDLPFYDTHQPGCPYLPHDDPCFCGLCPPTIKSVAATLIQPLAAGVSPETTEDGD